MRSCLASGSRTSPILETTVIPPEGDGPHGWIGEAQRVEELYDQALITLELALVEAAKEAARGKSDTIELGRDRADFAAQGSAAANGPERSGTSMLGATRSGWRHCD